VWTPTGTIGTNGPAWPSSIHGYKSWGDPSAVAVSIPTRRIGQESYGRFDIGCAVHKTEHLKNDNEAKTICISRLRDSQSACHRALSAEVNQRNTDRHVRFEVGSSCDSHERQSQSIGGSHFNRQVTCYFVETFIDLTDCTDCLDGFETKSQFNGKGGCLQTGTSFVGQMAPVRIYPGAWQHHQLAQFCLTFYRHAPLVDVTVFFSFSC
jgi:hypothetical protein